jgi:hypothetical protein
MTRESTYFILLTFLLTACSGMPDMPASDYYNISDLQIRLIVKHPTDSIVPTNVHNPIHFCRKLEMTTFIDTTKKIGVTMRFLQDNEANANYGPYEKGGLIEKIKDISISFENGISKKDITTDLKGDSTIIDYLWLNENYKSTLFQSWSTSDSGCYRTWYYRDIPALIKMSNSYKPLDIDCCGTDWLFWLDKSVINGLSFKPTKLKMQVTLVDSTGNKFRQLTDSTEINAP